MKKVAIVQSNYIPWKGYFDMIAAVDEFVIYDRVQFTKRDWRNRNKIKTKDGLIWLTVPVQVKGKYYQAICETELQGQDWRQAHWRSLMHNYGKAPHFREVSSLLEPILLQGSHNLITDLNIDLMVAICGYLGIETRIRRDSEFVFQEGKTERLLGMCKDLNATCYVSGPAAKSYLDENMFAEEGIAVEWFEYEGYPEYPQLWGSFEHGVSILDLLFNCGKSSKDYMKYVA